MAPLFAMAANQGSRHGSVTELDTDYLFLIAISMFERALSD